MSSIWDDRVACSASRAALRLASVRKPSPIRSQRDQRDLNKSTKCWDPAERGGGGWPEKGYRRRGTTAMVKEWYWNRSNSKEEGDPPGCMRGMFHFLHFHHLLFTGSCRSPATSTSLPEPELQYKQMPQQQPYHVSSCKELEAPRNSLELQEFETAFAEDYYGFPISIQIAQPPGMSKKKKKKESPAVTPRTRRNIVARLMGLQPAAPRRQPLRNMNSNFSGSLSLPDSPRASSERPRDAEPRFSLQLDKENQCLGRELMMKRSNHCRERCFGFDGDENTLRSTRNKPGETKYLRKNISMDLTVSSPKAGALSKPVKNVQKQYPSPTSLHRAVKALKMEPSGKCSKSKYERFTERIARQCPQPTAFKEEASPIIPTREDEEPEMNYVKAIVALADVSMKRFSLSLPIDPSIFDIREFRQGVTTSVGALQDRWNRKLLFHLVEEILGDLLNGDPNRWLRRSNGHEQLLSRVWSEIRSLPGPAVCQVVGDIDSLVARDLPVAKFRPLLRHPSLVAEARLIATEIERDILSSLLGEAAESLCLICS
ncbi:hypothetical protein KSP40_PGU000166 [Platanthera guangdongensis]|uniref:DUF4378 domain-containing protein n=1 Tax=Platanthera guangdongensis TaxID=2320717 RepID=A0ABR2LMF8_9ASPA